MATVSTSLRMFDQMTRPLQQITNALNLTISAMDDMNNKANRDIKITNTLNTARDSIKRASSGLQELADSQDKAKYNQENLNNSFNRGINSSDGLASKIKGLVGAYLGFQAVKKGIDSTIGGAANLERQLITISGMLGNKDVGKAFFNGINDYALISQYGLKDFAAISRQFIQFTKNTDKLMDLNKLAERLAFLDPTQGLEGAGFALKEILGGDGMSLKGRFGFGPEEIKNLKASKDMDDFMNKFDKMLNRKGGTQLAVEEAAGAALSLWDNLIANISTSFSKAGNNALEALKPLLRTLNEGFREGRFQPFFDGLSKGIVTVVNITMKLIDVFSKIGNIVGNNWSIISPIVWGIVAAMIAYNTVSLITNGIIAKQTFLESTRAAASSIATGATFAETVAQHGLNAALYACPLTWIIIAIIILIALFYAATAAVNHFAGTSVSATGLICGAFMTTVGFVGNLFVTFYNAVADIIILLYNMFATFAEFIANVFVDPVGAIVRLFAGMGDAVLEILQGIASAIDTIFGSNLADAVSGWREGLQGAVDDLVGEAKIKVDRLDSRDFHMERFNYGNEFDYGYGKGAAFSNGVKDMFKIPEIQKNLPKGDLGAWNKKLGPGKLAMGSDNGKNKGLKDANKHLKNIDDKIDVSNEHLEMMRDLAEMESIQNFVTLQPNVNFGDVQVKEEADINKIISKIETYMENQLVNSAEGVYV
ncbi:hypothetical protein [Clostridium rectalis]|uniref:hypothetical protein n=1 Tax=Clostridium rectalis TaxID=2040295 RepID=UPI000F63A82C|nr:hypothetical protein [Clostridium rectalis]